MDPNGVASSTHLVHILAVAGSLMILIGSAGQARESLHEYQKEFKRLRHELGESFSKLGGAAVEISRLYAEQPSTYNELLDLLNMLQALARYIYPRIRRRTVNPSPTELSPVLQDAQIRMRSLLRTLRNWSFIMFGSTAILIGTIIDLITSW